MIGQNVWRWAAGAALLTGAALGLTGSIDIFGRAHGPTGRLVVAKPQFIWEVWTTGADRIAGATASVNGTPVRARYDSVLRRIIADPAAALSPGRYNAEIVARFEDGGTVKKDWEFEVAPEAVSDLPEPDANQLRTLDWVNTFRRQIGQAEFLPDRRLNLASMMHSRYLAQNGTTGHFQKPDKPLFFGADPGDRAKAVGYVGDSWETVEFGSTQPEESLRNLVDAPYHRIPFLQPGPMAFGSGHHSSRLTCTFQVSSAVQTVVYPLDDQLDVPTSWARNERPDPLRIHAGARRPVGYPIMLVHFAQEPLRLTVRSARLSDLNGNEVPCYLNTPDNDDQLKNALILMPKAALAPKTTYSVRVDASVTGGIDVSQRWTFTTKAAPAGRSGGPGGSGRPPQSGSEEFSLRNWREAAHKFSTRLF